MENMNSEALVRAVNSTLTGRRDHRAAIKRFNALPPGEAKIFREAFRALWSTSDSLAEFKKEVGDFWEKWGEEGSHSYFFNRELNVIEVVVGKSW